MKRACLLHPQRPHRTQGRGAGRAGWVGRQKGCKRVQTRSQESSGSWEEAQAGKSRPYPGNGSSSRIQCGAVTGPPYLANFRQKGSAQPRAPALEPCWPCYSRPWPASPNQTVDRQSVETGLRTGFRPRTSRVTFERAKRRLPTNERVSKHARHG